MDNNSEARFQDLSDALNALSRLDIEWISFVALRDAIAVALRDVSLATRNETLKVPILAAILNTSRNLGSCTAIIRANLINC